jgi:hypothetical protein
MALITRPGDEHSGEPDTTLTELDSYTAGLDSLGRVTVG